MTAAPSTRSLLIVVAAPSGAGKTTLCERLLAEFPGVTYSVSCTTRAPRGREVDGEDYHFLTADEFERRVAAGDFLEHAVVHGHRYGTLRSTVEAALRAGRSVLLDIDVQGAATLRAAVASGRHGELLQAGYVDVFIEPPSLEALRARLAARGEDSAAAMERRLANAAAELGERHRFRYRIVNDELETAYAELRRILQAEWKA